MGIILFVTCWLLALSIMDIRGRRVPVWLLAVGGTGIGLVLMLQCCSHTKDCTDVLEGVLPGSLLLVIGFVTKKTGYGDGIVVLLLGMLLGAEECMALVGISLFFTSICSLALLALRKAGRNTKIPYIPFLTAAWLLVMNL